MAKLRTNQSVKSIIEGIDNEEFQLPSIQRPFVWEPEQLLRLLDSIMCEYPMPPWPVCRATHRKVLVTERNEKQLSQ